MYDPLTATYALPCPAGAGTRIPLSSFRMLVRLPVPSHPPLYRIAFACRCGSEHAGLVSQADLDWAHLGAMADLTFRNLMTARDDPVGAELSDAAATRIGAGEWPWSFYCYLEGRARPVTPSAFALIAPGGPLYGVAVECPACAAVSVNLVTQQHVDIPFWNDPQVGVITHVFERDSDRMVEEFSADLAAASFDERRLDLAL